jgi:hypothetical protein
MNNGMKNMSIVSSPGRVSVMGEHSWLVKEAVMLGIDEYRTYVKIVRMPGAVSVQSVNFRETIDISDRDIDQADFSWIDYVKGCMLFFENNFDIKIKDISISINSVLPIEAGLSSSAALVSSVGGKLEDRLRYSKNVIYNTFPFPKITEQQKEVITKQVYNILDEREKYPGKTLAELYDTKKMPYNLKQAHEFLDEVIDRIYRVKPFENDEERLAHLFKLYEEMVEKEKQESKK